MLNKSIITDVLYESLLLGGDFAEIFIEDKNSSGYNYVGGKLEKAMQGNDFGLGIRIFIGLDSIYAYTNDLRKENLIKIVREAMYRKKTNNNIKVLDFNKYEKEDFHKILIDPRGVESKEKVELMKRAYNSAKKYNESIVQVNVNYIDYTQNILIANTEGIFVEDSRTRTRLAVSSIAELNGSFQTGSANSGAHKGFELYSDINVEDLGTESARIAKTMVSADYAPSEKMTVVMDNGFGGVLFHEACGHGLEATSVAKGISVFSDKLGKKVASDIVSAVDDGTIPNAWGSQNIDDEGSKTRKNVLIENGILKSFLIDKLNGKKMGMQSTSSARRESYKFAPTSRMTNTFIESGKSSFEDIISNTEYGLYTKHMGGGSVDPSTGDFNFAVMEGYIIRNGKIEKPVRGASLIGRGIDILSKIDMVGNNLTQGQGMCGSISGSIPTNVGQPALRISEITVGGRKESK